MLRLDVNGSGCIKDGLFFFANEDADDEEEPEKDEDQEVEVGCI